MKSIENKTTTIAKEGEVKHTYADLLTNCLNNSPAGGFTPELMGARLRVIEAAKKGGPTIELEDADAKTAKDAVNSMKWGVMHADLVAFTTDCNAAF